MDVTKNIFFKNKKKKQKENLCVNIDNESHSEMTWKKILNGVLFVPSF